MKQYQAVVGRLAIPILLLLVGCTDEPEVSFSSANTGKDTVEAKRHCNNLCKSKLSAELDFVGFMTGNCYCKDAP